MNISRKIGDISVETFTKDVNSQTIKYLNLNKPVGLFIEKSYRVPLAAILIGECFAFTDIKGLYGNGIISTAFEKGFPIDDAEVKIKLRDDITREDVLSRYFIGDIIERPLVFEEDNEEVSGVAQSKVIGVLISELKDGSSRISYSLMHGSHIEFITEQDLVQNQIKYYNSKK